MDDLKNDILKLIDKVEDLEQKIINLNWKTNSTKKEHDFQFDRLKYRYDKGAKSS
jgi:hypothetical protein